MKMIDMILCDDVRDEVNDKHSIIGIHGPKINIKISDAVAKPYKVKFCMFSRFMVENDEDRKITKITVEACSITNKEPIILMKDNLVSFDNDTVFVNITIRSYFNMDSDQAILLRFHFKNEDKIKTIESPYNVDYKFILTDPIK